VGKNKLLHFEENRTFPHFFQPDFKDIKDGYKYRGNWGRSFFGNDHPIVVELGCGKGEYTVGLARKYPERNFIGIDKKGARMWRGAKTSHEEQVTNVAFLRLKIEQLGRCFASGEISEIWITFPDPVLKLRRMNKRLTAPRFLDMYRSILKPGGVVHLKTDNREFFSYTLDILKSGGINILYHTQDLYQSGFEGDAPQIQTYYEKKYLEERIPINYLKFNFDRGHETG